MPAIGDIALRTILPWLSGIIVIAGVSACTARPSRTGRVSVWLAIPALAGMIGICVGVFGAGLIASRFAGPDPPFGKALTALAATVLCAWFSGVAIQVGQNIGYRATGAPTRPIRWYRRRKS